MALKTVTDLGHFIRDQRRTARLSLRKLSNMAGVSNPYLSQIERGLRKPSAEILQSIARALAISAETLYVKAGILDERPEEADVAAAIGADASLTDKQRQTLVEIYQSFRHENELERAQRGGRTAKLGSKQTTPKRAKKPAAKQQTRKTRTTQRTTQPRKSQAKKKASA